MLSLICMLGLSLSAATWQTFTNTDHVYDININGSDIYISSWGGMVKLKPNITSPQSLADYIEDSLLNTGNGLASNDIRSIAHIGFSNSLWMGSSDAGITIQSAAGTQYLTPELGLPSIRVNKIIEHQSSVLVATPSGIASYYYLAGVGFPLMLNQYTAQNTAGGLAGNNIEDMVLTADNKLFVSTSLGLSYIPLASINTDSAWQSLHGAGSPIPAGLSSKLAINTNKIAIAQQGKVYVNSLTMDNGQWLQYSASNLLSGSDISSVALDDSDRLWVSYGAWKEDSLSYLRPNNILLSVINPDGTVQHWTEGEAGLGTKTISRIVFVNNHLYLCSWGDGIYQKSGNEWLNFTPSGIAFPKITQIVTDNNNAIWIASGYISPKPVRKGSLGVSKYQNGIWRNYDMANSPIHTDNILTVAVDSRNRKWFGTWDINNSPTGWKAGISIYDESTDIWKLLRRSGIRTWNHETGAWGPETSPPTLLTSTIAGIYPAGDGNMMVLCYDGGVSVVDSNDNLITNFRLQNSVNQRSLFAYFNGEKYFFGTNNDLGLIIWNHPSLPVTDGIHWVIPTPSELRNCIVYGVVTVNTPYEGKQHWIAASTGLFMWNESSWYRYDTMVKRFRYSTTTNTWQNDILYYVDEERLFGSVRTTPTSILLDPFNRIWIGSLENGLTMYDPEVERFTNFYKPNHPMLSNNITTLGYDPVEGNLLIGTPDGLNTLRIGRTVKPETDLNSLKAFPNPFRPTGNNTVQIVNLPNDSLPGGESTCRIYDSSGALVVVIKENRYSRFEWNGKSTSAKDCGSGIYFFVVSDEQGNTKRGKLALIR
jgi:ligand-binding sensor domain-containing protein